MAPVARLSLQQHLRRTLIRLLATCALVAGGAATGALLRDDALQGVPQPLQEASIRPTDPVEQFIERHDCWTDSAPADMAGALPGHVIVTRRHAESPEYAGHVMVGRALEHVFHGRYPDLAVHAFCR